MAVGAISATAGSSRQIIWKASEPVSDRVRPEPGWHSYIIAVSDLSACVVQFNSADYMLIDEVSVRITGRRGNSHLTPP